MSDERYRKKWMISVDREAQGETEEEAQDGDDLERIMMMGTELLMSFEEVGLVSDAMEAVLEISLGTFMSFLEFSMEEFKHVVDTLMQMHKHKHKLRHENDGG